MGGDEDSTVKRFIAEYQEEIIAKLEDDSLLDGILRLMAQKDKSRSNQIIEVLQLITQDNVLRTERILKKLIGKDLQKDQLKILFIYFKELDKLYHEMVASLLSEYLTPQIAHGQLSSNCCHIGC